MIINEVNAEHDNLISQLAETIPIRDLIKLMEANAYSLARKGQNQQASALFVAVAALESV